MLKKKCQELLGGREGGAGGDLESVNAQALENENLCSPITQAVHPLLRQRSISLSGNLFI